MKILVSTSIVSKYEMAIDQEEPIPFMSKTKKTENRKIINKREILQTENIQICPERIVNFRKITIISRQGNKEYYTFETEDGKPLRIALKKIAEVKEI